MSRSLSSASSLENLRKEAKRWLRSLRAGDADAIARLRAIAPDAPLTPGLRDVQLALAREYGLPGWNALRDALERLGLERQTEAERIDVVLKSCTWRGDAAAALRLLRRWPATGERDFLCSVARGNVAVVARFLAADPSLANRRSGPLDREPLLYLTYGRVCTVPDDLAVARLLLDHGADPNASWDDGWGNPFTPLCGVIGLGEGVHPPHPLDEAFATLLIERGASPFDTQALYNTSIVGDDARWLEFLWTHGEAGGTADRWLRIPETGGLGGKFRCSPIDYLLGNAVSYGHVRRAEWLLVHGANANGIAAYTGRPLREEALLYGRLEVAAMLERHGARPTVPDDKTAFELACFALDRDGAARLAQAHPAFLHDAAAMIRAAILGRADVVALLLSLGVDPDVADEGGVRALQRAIGSNSRDVVELLLAHDAEIDRPSKHYGGAMGFAAHFRRKELAELLAPRSRDVHNLVNIGMTQRLVELLVAEPALANLVHPRAGITPLFALPEDESLALEMATLLLRHGADPRYRNREGLTPIDMAARRGLFDVADLLETTPS